MSSIYQLLVCCHEYLLNAFFFISIFFLRHLNANLNSFMELFALTILSNIIDRIVPFYLPLQ